MLSHKEDHTTFTLRRERYLRKAHPTHYVALFLRGKLLLFLLLFLLLIGLIITSNALV
jgi:hypothetical protein